MLPGQAKDIFPGQRAIIRNCRKTELNGEQVICEKYSASLDEWLVKGDRFPLSIGMSLGAQCLELEPFSCDNNAKNIFPGQRAIIHSCRTAELNGQRVICEKYNACLDEWLVKGERFPLSIGLSLGAQFLELEVSSSDSK